MTKTLAVRGLRIEYELRRTQRKSVECRVGAEEIIVFAPMRMPLYAIERFLAERMEWIIDSQEKMRVQAEKARALRDGQKIILCSQALVIHLAPGGRPRAYIEGDSLFVCGDAPEDTLRAFLIEYARSQLKALVSYYAPVLGCAPKRIAIREQKTKWGSCSSLGNLNFNWRLVLKPRAAMEYVVVHELCHMIHLNHSPEFWNLVEKILPDYRARRQMLK